MPDLNQKLSTLRDQEMQKRQRASDLAGEMEKRDLNSDELTELTELEAAIGDICEQQKACERSLRIGDFHQDANDKSGMSGKEVREYSVMKLIRAIAKDATQKDRDNAGFELELSQDVESRLKVAPRGHYLPLDLMGDWSGVEDYEEKKRAFVRGETRTLEHRDLTADVFAAAGALVGVDFRPNQLIPLLRNKLALTGLQATFLDGLVGDVAIPKQTGGVTAGWVGSDGGTIGEGTQTVGQVTLTPRTLGVFTDYSRQLRLQSSISIENFVRADLMASVALAKDLAAFHGTGSSGQPLGIANVTGIGTQSFSTGSTPTRAEVIGLRSDLSGANALDGNLAYATETTVYGNMLDTAVDAGSGRFLLDENGLLLSRPVVESNQIEDGLLFFGNWADLLVGTWGGMDLMVDPFTGATAGNMRVLIFHSTDIAVRNAESFSLGQ